MFRKFLPGRYFEPHREERIFMFLDLRSSTTIAEQLGEERYFSFLKEVFQFATPAILENQGEIYQYVGDEIVVSWEMDKGIRNANCINCYFDIQEQFNQRKTYFKEKYEVFPEFKAGIHQRHVMAGEIGVVKREIAYSGDVLNTAAIIQSKGNDFGVNILFSNELLQKQFEDKYGVIPGFKAGIHLGAVTTGEIGALKREIVFTGDVLNTAARIQAMCKTYERTLIVSNELITTLEDVSQLKLDALGSTHFRGRGEKTALTAISRAAISRAAASGKERDPLL